jgi:ABC-2 type transport system permease protein
MQRMLRRTQIYLAIAAMVPKEYFTYRVWFWIGMILRTIGMTIYVFFWRAVYADTNTIAGLNLQQALTYILLAQVFSPLMDMFLVFEFGYNLREGAMAIALLRPVSLQGNYYVQSFSRLAVGMVSQIPLVLVATFVFGLQWPGSPAVWAAFLVTVYLGRTVLFFFDWILACLTFYTTEVWGLGVLIEGISLFLGGGLVPLVMMPVWLQVISQSFPFAQALYVPLSVLTGIVPLSQVAQVWLVQAAWIAGLGILARLIFNVAIRKVTVQGG